MATAWYCEQSHVLRTSAPDAGCEVLRGHHAIKRSTSSTSGHDRCIVLFSPNGIVDSSLPMLHDVPSGLSCLSGLIIFFLCGVRVC